MVTACGFSSNEKLIGHADDLKSHQRFGVCYGYGCKYYQKTGLTEGEWRLIRALFMNSSKSAAEERFRIAQAIAMIEQFIGPKTGTELDKAKAQVINFNTRGQMDCIDEAFNSTTYLYLLSQDGLFRWHSLGAPLRRNFNELSYPHSTATIHEVNKEKTVGGEGHYVVDSWFHKNGALAETPPAKVWLGPWYPEVKLDRYNFSAS